MNLIDQLTAAGYSVSMRLTGAVVRKGGLECFNGTAAQCATWMAAMGIGQPTAPRTRRALFGHNPSFVGFGGSDAFTGSDLLAR